MSRDNAASWVGPDYAMHELDAAIIAAPAEQLLTTFRPRLADSPCGPGRNWRRHRHRQPRVSSMCGPTFFSVFWVLRGLEAYTTVHSRSMRRWEKGLIENGERTPELHGKQRNPVVSRKSVAWSPLGSSPPRRIMSAYHPREIRRQNTRVMCGLHDCFRYTGGSRLLSVGLLRGWCKGCGGLRAKRGRL